MMKTCTMFTDNLVNGGATSVQLCKGVCFKGKGPYLIMLMRRKKKAYKEKKSYNDPEVS